MSAEPIALIPGLPGVAPVMRVLSRFDRHQLETAAEVLIALMDIQDGDPDAEVTDAEDDFATLPGDGMPGCPIADAAEEDDPAGMCDEDGVNTALASTAGLYGPGCPISDPAEGLGQEWQP